MQRHSTFLLSLLLLLCAYRVSAQTSFTIKGFVTDARTGEGVPFASVSLLGRPTGALTDEKGQFSFQTKVLTDSLLVSSMSYTPKRIALSRKLPVQTLSVLLEPVGVAMREVIVRAGENPAYRVLRAVRHNRDLNDRSRIKAYEHDSYAKLEVALSHLSDKPRANGVLKRVTTALSRMDTLTDDEGNRLLPLFFTESFSRNHYRDNPSLRYERILKTRVKGLAIIDDDLLQQVTGGNAFSYNFYNNFLPFGGKDFASPIGEGWKGWYEYYMADTLDVAGHTCYEIHFDPKRPQDLVFTGKMWIDTTSFALCQMDARVGEGAAINYVRQFEIEQELEPVADSLGRPAGWLPNVLRLTMELTGVGKKSLSLRVKRTTRSANFMINQPRPVAFYAPVVSVADSSTEESETYWRGVYHELAGTDSLNRHDRQARAMIDSIRTVPLVRRLERIGDVAISGWYTRGGVDFGAWPFTFAINDIEGFRTRVGFRTNDQFSRTLIFRGFLAYGTLDQRFKGGAEVDWLLSRTRWTLAGVRFNSDIERLGLTPDLVAGNRLFFAANRFGRVRGAFQNEFTEAFIRTEPWKGVMFTATAGHRRLLFHFPFHYRLKPELGDNSPLSEGIHDSYWSIEARLARKETYIMDGNERITLGTKRAPVLTLKYTQGSTAVEGQFRYHRFQIKAFQTFRVGQLGRSQYTLLAGYTPNTLPAPLLFPHTGNPTFFFVPNTFNRMNFYEFVSDKYVALYFQHRFEGLLFNRLPLVKKWNWRLVANADLLWGSQRQANKEVETYKELPNGLRPLHFGHLDPKIPYVEVGYGVENIFKIVRIQAVHRLTYLTPGTPRFIVKGTLQFGF